MKRIYSVAIAFLFGILASFAEQIKVSDIALVSGSSTSLEIGLENTNTNLVAFQIDLTLPEGIGIEKSGCTLSSRITDEDQVLTIGRLNDNTYRLTSTSLSLTPISGTSGTLLTLKLTSTSNFVNGQASFSNVLFSTATSQEVAVSDASFTINTLYTLTYKVDGEVYKTSTVAYGTAITPEAAPTKEGHTFSGWSEIPATMPANDVVITGTFSVNSYTLTYKVDGEVYKTSTVAYGTAITPEAAPTKEGHTFSGWSEIPATMPANDVVITGSFSVNSYTLTYKVDGEVYKTSTVAYGTAITPETAPTKEGHTFSGWSEIPATMPANDVVITGTFSVNVYKLTYKVDGEVYKTSTVAYGTAITPETAPTKEGHTFSGWSEIPATMPANDVVITGTFTVNKYKVRYYVGQQLWAEDEVEYGAKLTLRDYTPENTSRYAFAGWDGEKYETMPAKDIEYHAMIITGVGSVNTDANDIKAIFDSTGRKLSKMKRGLNVLKMTDGTTRKVFR